MRTITRFAIAGFLGAFAFVVVGCGLVDNADELVEVQIVASDAFAGTWTVVELNSDVVVADTLRISAPYIIPPVIVHELVPRGKYEVRISVGEGVNEVARLNTRHHRSIWFDVDQGRGSITYRTARDILVIEG